MNMTTFERRLREALEWIVRLPLVGESELARLLGIDGVDARHLRFELDRRGYVDCIAPAVVGLDEQRHAAFLRPEALEHLAACSGFPEQEIVRRAPVRRADLLDRVPRIETVTGVNRLLAELAAALRDRGEAALADACSLPLGLATGRWWPQGVDAYGVVRKGQRSAPFFVAWDRAGAPDLHRCERVRRWARGGTDAAAVILVVCASTGTREVWERELERWYGRTEVRLTTVAEVLAAGPRSAIWSAPGSSERIGFEQAVIWHDAPVEPLLAFPASMKLPPIVTGAARLREWAARAATTMNRASLRERVAVLALATSADEKCCLEWLARHPRLSVSQLAAFLDAPVELLRRRFERLARCHAVQPTTDGSGNDLWIATVLTLRLLAAAEGVPWRRFKPNGAVSAPGADGAAIRRRSMAHELGINRVFTQIAVDARVSGWRLGVWRNEAETSHHFSHDGRQAWIRPDGSGALVVRGASRPFLLEYDRGTLDGGDFDEKFAAYRRYYAAQAWRAHFSTEPTLLFVCADDRAERRVVEAARRRASELPLWLTCEWRFTTDPRNACGLFGAVWRDLEGRGSRHQLFPSRGETSEAMS